MKVGYYFLRAIVKLKQTVAIQNQRLQDLEKFRADLEKLLADDSRSQPIKEVRME